MEKIYIFGHHNPDTDSVCAAITLSNYKNNLGMDTEPRILDDINKETAFVLNKFNVKKPKYLDNVNLQIKDIKYHHNYFMNKNDSIKKVHDFLLEKEITGLPLVDENNKFYALVTLKMILNDLVTGDLKYIHTSYNNILEVLNASEVLRYNEDIEGNLIVGGYRSDMFVNEIKLSEKNILITSNRKKIINYAIKEGVKNIILVGNDNITGETLEKAKKKKINIIKTKLDTFNTVKLISLTNYAYLFCDNKRAIYFTEDDYYDDFITISKKFKHNNYPVLEKNGSCLGLLRLTDLENVNKKKVILVDHNESNQSVTGLKQSEIIEIVDHHKIGDLTTNYPINFRNMAVGSTNTIIYNLYKEKNMEIDKTIAGLMLSGILSDTLILKSPTTTNHDIEAVKDLSKITELDYEKFGLEMFKEGSSLKGKTIEEIINTDIKSFWYDDDEKFLISQITTLDTEEILHDLNSYVDTIEHIKETGQYKFMILVVTDIIKGGSYFIYTKDAKRFIESGYNLLNLKQGNYIAGQISRKKQIVPAILSGINRLNNN